MRMSGLSKVEMSAFIGGRGRYGNGANRLEPTRTGPATCVHEVKRKHITHSEAARRLKVSDRHIRRLLVELGKRGDRALLHGLRGRPSNRRLAARLELQILTRVRDATQTSVPHWPPSTWPRRVC
jgi:hypothetical protein